MLIRFNVKNFLSFSTRIDPETRNLVSHEFSMIPGKARGKKDHIQENDKQDLLKFAAVYGANASGKSNIIKALDFMKRTILIGKIPSNSTEKYCKTNPDNKSKPSYFSVEILLGPRCYEYGFEVFLQTGQFASEWLFEIGKDSVKCLFERNEKDEYKFENDLSKIQNLKIYATDMAGSNMLFLSLMNQNKAGFYQNNPTASVLYTVYTWFQESLDIIYPDRPVSDFSYFIDIENQEEVSRLISAFGTGISKIEPVAVEVDKILSTIPARVKNEITEKMEEVGKMMPELSQKSKGLPQWAALIRSPSQIFILRIDGNLEKKAFEIKFVHHEPNFLFDFSEESDGTLRLFELIEMLVSPKEKTYIIDELDRCLHPCLTYKFVETFLSRAKNRKVQLIVTSHESRLLDFNLLRRDEVWFVDKDKNGESCMYSLEEYNVRFDQKVDKAYMEGRYGGVPIFTTLFPIEKETK